MPNSDHSVRPVSGPAQREPSAHAAAPVPNGAPRRYPLTVITGLPGAGKSRLINDLLTLCPPEEHWAVLVNEGGHTDICVAPEASRVTVRDLTGACACCTGQVVFVTALATLIRQTKAARVLVELPSTASLAGLSTSVDKAFGKGVFVEHIVVLSRGGRAMEALALPPHVPATWIVHGSDLAEAGAPRVHDGAHKALDHWPNAAELKQLLWRDEDLPARNER